MRRALAAAALALTTGYLVGCATHTPPLIGVDLAAQPSPTDVGTPQRITIPGLHTDAPIVPVGLQSDGQLQVPAVQEVGWYRGSPDPGVTGPALLAGHVNWDGTPGAFARLAELKPGDQITVTGSKGAASFTVVTVATEPKPQVDWRTVLANVPDPELVLVTCGGTVSGHDYSDNVIVHAREQM